LFYWNKFWWNFFIIFIIKIYIIIFFWTTITLMTMIIIIIFFSCFFRVICINFNCFTFNWLNIFITNLCLTYITSFSWENFFNLKKSNINFAFLLLNKTFTSGPRSEVKTGLELKCNLSLEHVDKSLFLMTCIALPFWEYLYRVVHTPRTSSSRTFK